MGDRYAPYPYGNVFPVTPPHAAAWWDGKNKGYVKGHDVGWGSGYQKGMNENIDATFQSGYEKGKTAGYCKGYSSGMQEGYASGQQQGKSTAVSSEQIPHAKPHRQKRKCPSCGYAFVGLRQHAWAVHDLDLNKADYPLVED